MFMSLNMLSPHTHPTYSEWWTSCMHTKHYSFHFPVGKSGSRYAMSSAGHCVSWVIKKHGFCNGASLVNHACCFPCQALCLHLFLIISFSFFFPVIYTAVVDFITQLYNINTTLIWYVPKVCNLPW